MIGNKYLLVEDDEIFMYLHSHIIQNLDNGTTIIEKRSSMEALDYLLSLENTNEVPPSRILLDINMPELGGFQLLEKIEHLMKRNLKDTLVYMVSSSLYEEDRKRALSYWYIKGFVEKPMTTLQMKQIVEGK
jgi:CheY-like chemotaxis protein